jgi:hypothetical protein
VLKQSGTAKFAFRRHVPLSKGRSPLDTYESTVFPLLYISWGVITVVLVALLSYRATLLSEGNQIFNDTPPQDHHQQEMRLVARKSLLTGEIIVLSVMSGVLLLTCVGFSI